MITIRTDAKRKCYVKWTLSRSQGCKFTKKMAKVIHEPVWWKWENDTENIMATNKRGKQTDKLFVYWEKSVLLQTMDSGNWEDGTKTDERLLYRCEEHNHLGRVRNRCICAWDRKARAERKERSEASKQRACLCREKSICHDQEQQYADRDTRCHLWDQRRAESNFKGKAYNGRFCCLFRYPSDAAVCSALL